MATTKKKDELELQQEQTTQQTTPAQSSTVQQAQSTLNQLSGRNYQSQWQPQINTMMDQYLNRDKFSYDVNADALYQQLRDQYRLMGQNAMMDTMGQAQAMTGGYGNSYAQSVGQQAYQGYMQQLNDKVPDLYQLALNRYLSEGDQMLDNMSLLMQQDSLDYDRYRDQMAYQDAAYDKLLALMTKYKYNPTAEEMEAAGMTEGQMDAILGKNKKAPSSGGKGGVPTAPGGPVPPVVEDTLSEGGTEFEKKLADAQQNTTADSKSWNDMSKKRMEQAYNSGKITAEDVVIIAKKYGIT